MTEQETAKLVSQALKQREYRQKYNKAKWESIKSDPAKKAKYYEQMKSYRGSAKITKQQLQEKIAELEARIANKHAK